MPAWLRVAAALILLAHCSEEGHETHEAAHEAAHEVGGHGQDSHGHAEHDGHEVVHDAEEDAAHGSHGHGSHGGEAIGSDSTNLGVAAMLLGSVIFNMSMFYLVNHTDEDIKHNSWAVLSATIAIFVSVLLFKGMQGIVDTFIAVVVKPLVHDAVEKQVLIWLRYVEFVLWYMVMYITLRSQASEHGKSVNLETGRPASQRTQDSDLFQKLTCWATLFAHMSAFAAMSGGSALQAHPPFSEVPILSFVPVLVTAALEFLLFKVRDRMYERGTEELSPQVAERMEEHGEEAETEIGGLSLSFLTVQALTFVVVGELPVHGGGSHHAPKLEPVSHTVTLVVMSLVFVALTVGLVGLSAKVKLDDTGPHGRARFPTWFLILQCMVAMCFAWCLFRAFEWEVSRFLQSTLHAGKHLIDPHATTQRVLLALSVSFMSFGMIFALDWLHDLPVTGDLADAAIKKVIKAIGILIGFSWEEAFSSACDAFAGLTQSAWGHVLIKFALGLTVAIVVIPAWRIYILKNVIENEKHHREADDDASSRGSYGPLRSFIKLISGPRH